MHAWQSFLKQLRDESGQVTFHGCGCLGCYMLLPRALSMLTPVKLQMQPFRLREGEGLVLARARV